MSRGLIQSATIFVLVSLSACSKSIDYNGGYRVKSQKSNTQVPVTDTIDSLEASTASLFIFNQEMLSAVNAARAKTRKCGSRSMPAVPRLKWNKQLQQAAFAHSSNMARYNFFSHTGLDGKEVSQRVSEQGYHWRAVGENISAGAADVAAVVAGWLSSPSHCATIMSADYTEMAAAVVATDSAYYDRYWTQVFATSF